MSGMTRRRGKNLLNETDEPRGSRAKEKATEDNHVISPQLPGWRPKFSSHSLHFLRLPSNFLDDLPSLCYLCKQPFKRGELHRPGLAWVTGSYCSQCLEVIKREN